MIEQWITRAWYSSAKWLLLLRPLSLLYKFLSRRKQAKDRASARPFSVPVVIVGNIAVGGTGKTPVIIAIAKHLQSKELKVGVISRGYGSQAPYYPFVVDTETSPLPGGDEPCLIAQRTGCPVVIAPDRNNAVEHLLSHYAVDIILGDDGLQHWKLHRDYEICVIDGSRGLGNGKLLPEGPLREDKRRVSSFNYLLINGIDEHGLIESSCVESRFVQSSLVESSPAAGASFSVSPSFWRRVNGQGNEACDVPDSLKREEVFAISGIGNPQRFFKTLESLNVRAKPVAFPDHFAFSPESLQSYRDKPVVMTAKDAVKCKTFAPDNWWYLDVEALLPEEFLLNLDQFLDRCKVQSQEAKSTES